MLGLGESELVLLETLTGARPPEEGARSGALGLDGAGDREGDGAGDGEGVHGVERGEEDGGGEHEEEEEGDAARFCTAWLVCVGSGTVGLLLAKVRWFAPAGRSLPAIAYACLGYVPMMRAYLPCSGEVRRGGMSYWVGPAWGHCGGRHAPVLTRFRFFLSFFFLFFCFDGAGISY